MTLALLPGAVDTSSLEMPHSLIDERHSSHRMGWDWMGFKVASNTIHLMIL